MGIKQEDSNEKLSFANKHPRLNILVSLIIFIVIVLMAVCILKWLYHVIIKLGDLASKLDAVIIVALITAVITFISNIIVKRIEYKKNREAYLAQKREKPYGDFIDMFFKLLEHNDEYTEEENQKDFSSFSKSLLLWGSPNVAKKWINFRKNTKNSKSQESAYALEEIINEMRKDMGTKKMRRKGSLFDIFVTDTDKLKDK